MSFNPQMLAQALSQGQQPSGYGGMQGQSALGGAGQMLQKIMMMRQMQNQNRPPQPQGGMPQLPIQGQGAPGGIAPDQPVDPTMNFKRFLQNPQGGMA